jgi:hypothetical protein
MRRPVFLIALFTGACVGSLDTASHVHDLRVLAASLEPPEIMAPMSPDASGPFPCDPSSLALYGAPLQYTALIADPQGAGRSIEYELSACADLGDLTCSNPGEVVPLARGSTRTNGAPSTELSLTIAPGLTLLTDAGSQVDLPGPYGGLLSDAGLPGVPLLAKVLSHDPNFGLGGFRMPLVLRVMASGDAGTEVVYAQKVMVYSCQFFPDMKPNHTPHLPGIRVESLPQEDGGAFEWPEDGILSWSGTDSLQLATDDISALEESYVVPSYDLTPVHFTEAWQVDWFGTVGQFGPEETGAYNSFNGQPDPNRTAWMPGSGADAPDGGVTFWFVVRNGRGGESWTERHLHYIP